MDPSAPQEHSATGVPSISACLGVSSVVPDCEGDRDGAIKYFKLCTQSSLIDGGYYHMAKAFKRLLEQHPDWADNAVR